MMTGNFIVPEQTPYSIDESQTDWIVNVFTGKVLQKNDVMNVGDFYKFYREFPVSVIMLEKFESVSFMPMNFVTTHINNEIIFMYLGCDPSFCYFITQDNKIIAF